MPSPKAMILICALFISFTPVSEDLISLQTPEMKKALLTLEPKEFHDTLAWWSADERGGREPGAIGSVQAGDWAAAEFERLGLIPLGDDDSFFQVLPKGGKRGLLEGRVLRVEDESFPTQDWSLLGGCLKTDLQEVEVVFAGYGITAPEYDYDDYKDLDVKDKAVLILRYEPQQMDKDSKWRGATGTRHSYFQSKLDNAKKRGAKAVLFVNGPIHHNPDKDVLSDLGTRVSQGEGDPIPMVHIRRNIANALLEPLGKTLLQMQERIDNTGSPASDKLPGKPLTFKAEVGDLTRARNVIGYLEGSDPRLKDEVVVVGAHYDHIGFGAYGSRTPKRKGEVHNGADDNGSGSVAVVELAEAIVEGGLKPKRSILFQLYDAEEKGLLGSRHYVANPYHPLEDTVAMINLDMIARVTKNKCSIMGVGTASEWPEILKAAQGESSIKWTHRESGSGGSDQASFLRKNIPVLFFFSGIHKQYHTPDDDIERCNIDGAVDVMQVALKTLMLVANRDARLTFKKPVYAASSRRRGPKFGVSTESAIKDQDKIGLRITRLVSGSGAEKAGLQKGDILLTVNDTPVFQLWDFVKLLRKQKPGDTVSVTYLRGDQKQEVKVILSGS